MLLGFGAACSVASALVYCLYLDPGHCPIDWKIPEGHELKGPLRAQLIEIGEPRLGADRALHVERRGRGDVLARRSS